MIAPPSLKIVTINIERSKHLDLVLPLLEREQPDVVCIQELCVGDSEKFFSVLGMVHCVTAPMTIHAREGEICELSIGIFSRYPVASQEVAYYHGSPERIPVFIKGDPSTINHLFLRADIVKDGETFRIGTTHFTWTPNGEADDVQRSDMTALLQILEKQQAMVFTGDFNAPRGREIFSRLCEYYHDNVPASCTTSIDGSLHRAGALPHMVDGIFSTPEYQVHDVTMVGGVSDHCALVARVTKVSNG